MIPNEPKAGPFKVGDRILDRFEVRGVLGKGGHAFVYDCFNAFLAEEVAIKVIPNPPHRGKQLFHRARGEAQMLYRLNHPNVVKVMDGGELDGMAYMVMEKLEGMTLREHLRKCKRLTPVEALSIALQVADALESAHAMNVIHRDLKPDNIFLLPGNRVKVLDFGIAKFLEGGYQTTQKDLIQGTAPYMSPEQAQGHGVTFASDIFQLGTVLYEMLAGICPCMIGADEPTLQVVVAMQIAKLPPRLKTVVRGTPDYVDLLVWRAIAKAAQQRYPSMRAFTDAIQDALERLKAELPPRELLMRVVRAPEKRTTGSAQRQSQPQLPEARTTPIALVTSSALKAARAALDSSHTEPYSLAPGKSPPGRRSEPTLPNLDLSPSAPAVTPRSAPNPSDPREAQRMLLRAALIGALLAIPAGIVIGLSQRTRGAPIVTASVAASAQAPAAAQPHIALLAAVPAAPSAAAVPSTPAAQNQNPAAAVETAAPPGSPTAVVAPTSGPVAFPAVAKIARSKPANTPKTALPSSGLSSAASDSKPESDAPSPNQSTHKPPKSIF